VKVPQSFADAARPVEHVALRTKHHTALSIINRLCFIHPEAFTFSIVIKHSYLIVSVFYAQSHMEKEFFERAGLIDALRGRKIRAVVRIVANGDH
jgi:hypothetical protein